MCAWVLITLSTDMQPKVLSVWKDGPLKIQKIRSHVLKHHLLILSLSLKLLWGFSVLISYLLSMGLNPTQT